MKWTTAHELDLQRQEATYGMTGAQLSKIEREIDLKASLGLLPRVAQSEQCEPPATSWSDPDSSVMAAKRMTHEREIMRLAREEANIKRVITTHERLLAECRTKMDREADALAKIN